jgi:hypothetical protein
MTRVAGVALAIVAALAAGAASASAAAPEFGRCVKMAGGHFGDPHCTEEPGAGGNAYEWAAGPGADAGFTLFASRLELRFQGNGAQFCKPVHATGTITGPKTVADVVFSMECEEAGFGCEAVETEPMRGQLGVYSLGATAAQNGVGLKLEAEAGDLWAEFGCHVQESPFVWTGGFVIGQLQTNEMSRSLPLKFKDKHLRNRFAVEQQPMSFLGEEPDQPEGTLAGASHGEEKIQQKLGWKMASRISTQEPIEVRSVT